MVDKFSCGMLLVTHKTLLRSLSTRLSLDSTTTPSVSTGLMTQSKAIILITLIAIIYLSLISVSSFLVVGSRDTSCRVFSAHPLPDFHYVNLAAHRTKIVACFFEKNSLNVSMIH